MIRPTEFDAQRLGASVDVLHSMAGNIQRPHRETKTVWREREKVDPSAHHTTHLIKEENIRMEPVALDPRSMTCEVVTAAQSP